MPSDLFGRILAPPWGSYQTGIMPLQTLNSAPSEDPLLHMQPCESSDSWETSPGSSINQDPLMYSPNPRGMERRAYDWSFVEDAPNITWPTQQEENIFMSRQALSSFLKENDPINDPAYQVLRDEISSHKLSIKQLNDSLVYLEEINKSLSKENSCLTEEKTRLTQENSRLTHDNIRIGQDSLHLSQENTRLGQDNLRLSRENLRLTHDLEKEYKELNSRRKKSFLALYASHPNKAELKPPMGFFIHNSGTSAASVASLNSYSPDPEWAQSKL